MAKASFVNIRVTAPIASRAEPMAELLRYSKNRFAELCVEAVLEMIETAPTEREIPKLVRMVDAAREIHKTPAFPKTPSHLPKDVRDAADALKRGKK